MNILVDMNLSPGWADFLNAHGHQAMHWSRMGAPSASDGVVMGWARDRGYVVLTHDLDFGAILAATGMTSPSVVQLRGQGIFPATMGNLVLSLFRQFQTALQMGALISVDTDDTRVRLLPLGR